MGEGLRQWSERNDGRTKSREGWVKGTLVLEVYMKRGRLTQEQGEM